MPKLPRSTPPDLQGRTKRPECRRIETFLFCCRGGRKFGRSRVARRCCAPTEHESTPWHFNGVWSQVKQIKRYTHSPHSSFRQPGRGPLHPASRWANSNRCESRYVCSDHEIQKERGSVILFQRLRQTEFQVDSTAGSLVSILCVRPRRLNHGFSMNFWCQEPPEFPRS